MGLILNSSGGGGGASIAEDMYFANIAARDAFVTNNPSRMTQGVTCAVTNGSAYDYYQWDAVATQWRDANLIFQGSKGAQGDAGQDGAKGDTVKISAVTNSIDADDKLVTEVALDDGTKATSTPIALPDQTGVTIDGTHISEINLDKGLKADVVGDVATISQDVTHDVWDTQTLTSADTPFTITQQSQAGIDYVCDYQSIDSALIVINLSTVLDENSQIRVSLENTTSKSNVVQVYGTDFNWHFSTPTVLSVRNGKWRVEESSQMLSISGAATYDASTDKQPITAIAVDPTSDLTSAVSEDGILVIGRTYTPQTDTTDIAFWWSDNAEPTAADILNAMSQAQDATTVSHTDNFYRDDLQKRTLTAKRPENSFKYLFFAWHKGFFNPEPTKIDTGWGAPSTWKETEVTANSEVYKVLTVEVKNNTQIVEDYALVQEGVR